MDAHRRAAVRRVVFERDDWRCVRCGLAGRLECDHVTPLERETKHLRQHIHGPVRMIGFVAKLVREALSWSGDVPVDVEKLR